jgi:phosphoglucomutase
MIYSQDREGITVGRRTHCRQINEGPWQPAPIGGLKVVARSGWFAARPSGTENIYKIYAESFKDDSHLNVIICEAQEIVSNALGES